jgi:glycerol-3-phosphate dehydrogenase
MIVRDVEQTAGEIHDVIIVGGGVYGCMVALEATARGLRPLLIESRDFGSQTSFNSFRIIHGGLRYLQSLDIDIIRLRESVRERRWFLRHFPDLVTPIPCLMPLYGRGLRRRGVFRLALMANDLLSYGRNTGLMEGRCLPAGKVVDIEETLRICPGIDTRDLEGAALWWDASMQDSQRLLMEVLRWAVAGGAIALNYVQAGKLLSAKGKACGIEALDHCTGRRHEFRGQVLINATGPWARQTAAMLDRDYQELLRPTLAWNILLDRPPPSDCALALQVADTGHTYFLQPYKGRLLAGTGHADWSGGPDDVAPSQAQLMEMLASLNSSMPGLELEYSEIIRVFAGLLPGKGGNGQQLADRPVIIDHGRKGGIQNLFSVSGVKFTTARRVAESVLDHAVGRRRARHDITRCQPSPLEKEIWSCRPADSKELEQCMSGLRTLVEQEAVVHLDDLVLRRSTLWEDSDLVRQFAEPLCDLFPWDEQRRRVERDRLAAAFASVLASSVTTAGCS